MKFFLDTANLEQIAKYNTWGLVDGVTTNPSLIAKEEGVTSLQDHIMKIAEIVDGPISSEVVATDFEGMLKEARLYHTWHPNIYVKLPMTENGLKTLKVCSEEGIKTNVTLIFSAAQALLAAKNGASIISPFVGRIDDISWDSMDLIEEIIEIYGAYSFDTEVLVASIRHPRHVIDSAKMGADIATMPVDVLEKMVHHPLTDIGLEKFLADWKKTQL
jgi:transaldolase